MLVWEIPKPLKGKDGDVNATDTLADKLFTRAPDLAGLFVEISKLLVGQTDDDLVGSATHGFSFLRAGVIGMEPLSSGIVISQYVAC